MVRKSDWNMKNKIKVNDDENFLKYFYESDVGMHLKKKKLNISLKKLIQYIFFNVHSLTKVFKVTKHTRKKKKENKER